MSRLIYLKRPKLFFDLIRFRLQIFFFRKIIKSDNAWSVFNEVGIEGFGVNLIRLYFPIYYDKRQHRESFSDAIKSKFTAIFDAIPDKQEYTNSIIAAFPDILKLPANESDSRKPYLDNYYFGICDAALLSVIMRRFKPAKIVEIGSGISTRYMHLFKETYSLNTEIICIDPVPRAEIEGVANRIIREPLEKAIELESFDLKSGDIVFLDGSHYVFQGNDTLTFFFKFLHLLPKGVIVHIHDIFLPYDYTAAVSPQLWNEQYIVAAMLLGGFKGYQVIYPAYYYSQNDENLVKSLSEINNGLKDKAFQYRKNHQEGFSFWFKKVQEEE